VVEGLQRFLLQVYIVEIVLHKADKPVPRGIHDLSARLWFDGYVFAYTMKPLMILYVVLTALTCCYGQTPGGALTHPKGDTSLPHIPKTAEEYRFETVKQLFVTGSPVRAGTVQLHRMGDEAAVYIIRIVGDQTLRTSQITTISEMVRTSFGRPAAIVNTSNRNPKGTLLLLQYLDAVTHDPSCKQSIADTRQFVLAATAQK